MLLAKRRAATRNLQSLVFGGDVNAWLRVPHARGGRIAVWGAAVFFWLMYIIPPTRRYVALAVAIAVSLAELVLVLNRLNIIRHQAAHATNRGIIGMGVLAALCWIWHLWWQQRAAWFDAYDH